jgi:SAM-dependent methyltransferase
MIEADSAYSSEQLHLRVRAHVTDNFAWVGGRVQLDNLSRGYHGIFKKWWDYFGLSGDALVVGEEGSSGKAVKEFFERTYPKIAEVKTASLRDADILWDITKPYEHNVLFDSVICQAVLEHVKDPVAAVKNMVSALKRGGLLYLHSHGPAFPYHAYPIDCYRFYRDGILAMAELSKTTIVDMLWTPLHWFAVLRPQNTSVDPSTLSEFEPAVR